MKYSALQMDDFLEPVNFVTMNGWIFMSEE